MEKQQEFLLAIRRLADGGQGWIAGNHQKTAEIEMVRKAREPASKDGSAQAGPRRI